MLTAEQTHQPQPEKTSPPPRERDALKHDREIENQREFFLRRLGYYEALLVNTPPNPEKLRKMAEKAATAPGRTEAESAADFFALTTGAGVHDTCEDTVGCVVVNAKGSLPAEFDSHAV